MTIKAETADKIYHKIQARLDNEKGITAAEIRDLAAAFRDTAEFDKRVWSAKGSKVELI